jgi:hypothetical protein
MQIRLDELQDRILRDLDNQAQQIYGQIMPLRKTNELRQRLETEYGRISKELTLRSDEARNIKQQMDNLKLEKTFGRK